MDKRVYDFLDDVRKSSESKIKQLEEEDPFGNQLSIRRYKNYHDSAIVLQRMMATEHMKRVMRKDREGIIR